MSAIETDTAPHGSASFGRSLTMAKQIESTMLNTITPREQIQVAEVLLSSAILKKYGGRWRGEIQESKYRMAKRLDRFEKLVAENGTRKTEHEGNRH